ncbi:hypothetical protein DEU56DRAFT_765475 [Suillus clintonianus]|uniref:uncharacterized protein n=1 Tax=Suillus clintonianus TaxID=1904413 RepID=UPI001B85F34B|nr:uncharacterized protein DEU56DRAFT_765475 [Suillus clintonianus]KAG2156083.1 hypothetical protein DEU56DRAFT_765475 [Suillus clintonianus]
MSTPMSPPASPSTSKHRPRRPTRQIPSIPNQIDDPQDSVPSEEHYLALTPLRAHYLKKSLIQLQFHKELDAITNAPADGVSTLAYLGPPFTPPPTSSKPLDLPFLKYIFRQFVLTFPLLAAADKSFYPNKLQVFVASALAKNISPTSLLEDENDPKAARLKLLAKLERNFALFFSAGTKLVEQEEVVRLNQHDLDRLEQLAKKRQARLAKHRDVFEVNIVCVRTVTDKGRVRSRVHEEFIIRTRLSENREVCVSRRYGDFKTLADELRKFHPEEIVPSPPVKDRTIVNIPRSTSPPDVSIVSRVQRSTFSDNGATFSDDGSSESLPQSPSSQQFGNSKPPPQLSREKNRLTLRAYLHSLMSNGVIGSSPVLKSFLLSGPTSLSPEEVEDSRRREDADRIRENGRKRFAHEIAGRVDGLRDAVKSVKGDIMGKDGLSHIFAIIKVTPDINQLPPNYRAVTEWGRITLASTIFQMFVASDTASETFASMKRLHGLMPYFLLRTALKISSPVAMIRSVVDIFLATPFGGRSLLQRMFSGSLTEEVRIIEEDIEAVKAKVDDSVMCEKLRLFVNAPREIQDTYRADAVQGKIPLLAVVLRSGEEPRLDRDQLRRVHRAHLAHATYLRERENLVDSDDDDGPRDEEAWLFEDLKVLVQLYSRLRDREQLIALIFEGVTAELLKEIISIFYAPLAQVYKAANIGNSVSDLQNFITDLIKVVEATEEMTEEDPQATVQTFIDLVGRHEQAFYSFVHKVHANGKGLFESLMRWVELFLTVVREGLGSPVSLEFLLPHGGRERTNMMDEIDEVARYHYKLKIAHEEKLRRRFTRAQGHDDADAEDEATQALVHGVVGEINFGELVQSDALDLAAEETDDESDEYSSEYETDSSGSYEDAESEESEEEGPTPTRSRVQTARPSPHISPLPNPLTPPPIQQPPPSVRQRSISLRSTKSAHFSHRSNWKDAPPVPPLPPSLHRADKPLPPPPPALTARSAENLRCAPDHKPHKPKGSTNTLKPPDLIYIPRLLPLFAEVMRPNLRRNDT